MPSDQAHKWHIVPAPTCAHEHTQWATCPSPAFPSFPSLFLLPPSPPLLLSSLGLEHWVPEPGLGSRQPGPPWRHCWTHCMHTPCLPAPAQLSNSDGHACVL